MSNLLPRNKSDHIYFIILFYYHVFKSLFTGAYPDSILLTFTIITEVLA